MSFGYPWWMTYGHLAVAVPGGLALAWLFWRKRAKVGRWLLAALVAWAVAAFLLVKFNFRLDSPIGPPTSRFLAGGAGKVLDLGCGSGRASIGLLLARKQSTVTGLDNWSADYIRGNGPDLFLANARAAGVESRISVQNADMRELPFGDAVFDGVISAYAVDHLDPAGISRTLAEAARVLRPGGEILILNLVRDAWTVFAVPPLAFHSSRRSNAASVGHGQAATEGHSSEVVWRHRLESAGFEVVEVGRRPGTLFFLARKPAPAAPAS
jgi:SAM-dependent methyltransferase